MRVLSSTIILLTLTLVFPYPTHAASKSFDITATSSLFSPSSISVEPGDVVTLNFTVPSNDSYCCGLEVRSSKFSTVTIAKGGSGSATFTADTSFTFSSYWPASQVHKADGTVTVQSSTPTDEISKPTVTKVQPSRFKRKTSGTFTITITGTEFETGVTVKVGKVKSQKVTRLSSTKLKAVIPRKNLKSGKHNVTVQNKDGGKATKKRVITIVP